MNVLCTPPAFILSQDQTLWCLYLIISENMLKSLYQSFRSALLLLFWVLFFSSKEFVEFRLCTFRSLFNFQGSFHQPPRLTPKQYITYVLACQDLFWGFFNFFSAYAKILLFFRWVFIISLLFCSCQVLFLSFLNIFIFS